MDKDVRNIVSLYKSAMCLKELPRQGWILEGALCCEADTVASHSFCVALISYLTAKLLKKKFEDINPEETTIMAIFHDLGEAATGEIATGVKMWIKKNLPANEHDEDPVDKIEHGLLSSLVSNVADIGGSCIMKLVEEYDEGDSKRARIVKFADVLDAFAHAKVRLNKTFPSYLENVYDKLNKISKDHSNREVGETLVQWLKQIVGDDNWDNLKKVLLYK